MQTSRITSEAAADAQQFAREHLARLLYKKTGLERPSKLDNYQAPFRTSYGGLDINMDGVAALTKYLESH